MLAMLALFVPICNIVTIVRTGQRIGQAQENTTARTARETAGSDCLLAVIGGFDLVYYQSNLNKLWAAAPQAAGVRRAPAASSSRHRSPSSVGPFPGGQAGRGRQGRGRLGATGRR